MKTHLWKQKFVFSLFPSSLSHILVSFLSLFISSTPSLPSLHLFLPSGHLSNIPSLLPFFFTSLLPAFLPSFFPFKQSWYPSFHPTFSPSFIPPLLLYFLPSFHIQPSFISSFMPRLFPFFPRTFLPFFLVSFLPSNLPSSFPYFLSYILISFPPRFCLIPFFLPSFYIVIVNNFAYSKKKQPSHPSAVK